ncbi:MAG: hypothetical protein KJO79_01210 [Verrucomicrobiae bacterium]|nr:hypothetical protein [Verrucomicrobiae bacterium]NNJ85764.1 hypothetical protein [Akkermansiaceae bacterium]
MYFLRKKRQKRDREAGLIFQWRGARRHHAGKMIAFMVAIGFFAFSVYAIKIDGIKPPLLSMREGVVIMLDKDDPNCQKLMFQIEQRSPFPVRWDPVFDQELMANRAKALEALHGELWQYDPELLPMPDQKPSRELASIIEPSDGLLGGMSDRWQPSGIALIEPPLGDLLIRARVRVTGGLESRITQDVLALPVDLVEDDWFGQTFRFYLSLDQSGRVSSCVPLMGGTLDTALITDRQKNLAVWLRQQTFKAKEAGDQGDEFGKLELQIEASRE